MEEILKHQTQSESGGNGGRESMSLLQVCPNRGTPPKAIGHNILNSHIMVRGIGDPRLTECVEPMANGGNVPKDIHLFSSISDM